MFQVISCEFFVPNYSYIAKNLNGEIRKGVLEAVNKRQLANAIREKGYILVSANQKKGKGKKLSFSLSFSFPSKVSLVDKIMFTRNLRVMIGSGLSLPRSLSVLEKQTKNKKFKKAILGIKEDINRGENFSDVLKKYPDIFSELFVSMVKVGEEAGTMENVLKVLTNQMEKDHQLKSKIIGAMMYPTVVLSAMLGIGTLMMIIVVPKLSGVYSDLNIELPMSTKFILISGNFMAKFWYIVFIGVFIVLIFIHFFLKTKTGKTIKYSLFLKTPILSPITKEINSAQIVRTLGSLIKAGVPIVRALKVTAETLGNIYYKKSLSMSLKELKKGNELSESLSRYSNLYPVLLIQMIKVGEETGETATILEKLADFYEEEVSNTTENLSSIIEPVLILVIGAAVAFFAISIIQPIYGIVQGIK